MLESILSVWFYALAFVVSAVEKLCSADRHYGVGQGSVELGETGFGKGHVVSVHFITPSISLTSCLNTYNLCPVLPRVRKKPNLLSPAAVLNYAPPVRACKASMAQLYDGAPSCTQERALWFRLRL